MCLVEYRHPCLNKRIENMQQALYFVFFCLFHSRDSFEIRITFKKLGHLESYPLQKHGWGPCALILQTE